MMKHYLAAASLALLGPVACADQEEVDSPEPAEIVETADLAEPQPVEAPETAAIGPDLSAPAPEFAAVSMTGDAVDIEAISGSNGAVVVFSRSLDWCPICKRQALSLETIAEDLADRGWALNIITYDAPETLAAYAQSSEISYALLSDTNSTMIDAFNLRNTEVPEGSDFEGIPHPAIFFLGTDGEIKAMLREEGYVTRPENDVILATADGLNGE